MSNPKPLKFAAALLTVSFLLALVLPLIKADFGASPEVSLAENRNLNAFPRWSWEWKAMDAFPAKFEAAFNDRFGFRALLVRWHSRLMLRGLGVSPSKDVIMGKQGWLYLSQSISEYRGVKKRSPDQADAWVTALKAKKEWLAARNIRYLLVVPPNKEEVYPEYLPASIRAGHEERFMDCILARLGPESGVEVLDLRETMRKGKALGPVYDRTDTHWSELGMFLASNEIVLRLGKWFPTLQPAPLAGRTLSFQKCRGGDLTGMVGLGDELFEERISVTPTASKMCAPGALRLQTQWPLGELKAAPMAFECREPGHDLTVLITGDSFGVGLMQYLPEHFRRTVRLSLPIPYSPWFQSLMPQLVDAEKPDIYLDVLVARHITRPPVGPIGGK